MAQKTLPYPTWTDEDADRMAGIPFAGIELVTQPRRHYKVSYQDGTVLAFEDSPSKVTGATEDKPGLTWWSAGLAADYLLDNINMIGFDIDEEGHLTDADRLKWWTEARKQHDTRKTDAGDIGSAVHLYIEHALKVIMRDAMYPFPEHNTVDPKIIAGIEAFREFWILHDFRCITIECLCAHPWMGYAGMIDAVAIDPSGTGFILDWKTSNAIRPSYYRQVGAYALAWNEQHPDTPITESYIVRLGKEGKDAGKFEAHHLDPEMLDWSMTAYVQSLYLYRYTKMVQEKIKQVERGQPAILQARR